MGKKYQLVYSILFFAILTVFSPSCSGEKAATANSITDTIKINPSVQYQRLEGWGVSLMWWAHEVGKSYSDAQIDTLCKWLVSPSDLNMNIFRFNIGGGDNPKHHHMRKDAQMPGYLLKPNGAYDWGQDAGQRKILLKIHQLKPNAIFEAGSYSAPYWMTISGCTSGNTNGSDNLQTKYYSAFADYLTTVIQHYHDVYGIRFRTISPMNEPYAHWWKTFGSQEGCAFSQANQERLIKIMYDTLKKKEMLSYCGISAMDANSIDSCLKGVKHYAKDHILQYVSQINTHSYSGNKRDSLYQFANHNHIRLWQSESGPLGFQVSGYDNFLQMAQRIIIDMRELKPVAWCDWQYMSPGLNSVWALVGYDENNHTFERTKGFYLRKQFSKYILPGYTFIGDNDNHSIAALSPDHKKLVIIYVQEKDSTQQITFDLSRFQQIVLHSVTETTAQENCQPYGLPNEQEQSGFNFWVQSKSTTTFIFNVSE